MRTPAPLPALRDLTPLLFYVLLLPLAGCSAQHAVKGNLDRCIDGHRGCEPALLTRDEQERLLEWHKQQHLQDCLAGLRCNEALLTEAEQRPVRAAAVSRNFQACLRAESECDKAKLGDTQREDVELADRARHFEFCLGGLTTCDAAALSDAQRGVVRSAYLERNYRGCMNAVGTLLKCNADDLSDAQREQVRRRNQAMNLYACNYGTFGCDESLLTPGQRASVQARRQRQD